MNKLEVQISDKSLYLDTMQLNRLEAVFREWAEGSPRADVRYSRRRLLIIFLLIRYTGAKLNEVLGLDPYRDINIERGLVVYRSLDSAAVLREVNISQALCSEIQVMLADPPFKAWLMNSFKVDPGFVRRKFYELAQICGFPKRSAGPEMIRKARAVELMQSNVPLPAVQMMLGHSTPNLTSAYFSFSTDEMQQLTRLFIEREAQRKTSARNSFFGKIRMIQRGDIQSRVELVTMGGYSLVTVITNDSSDLLGLALGKVLTAEVKAPWVVLHKDKNEPLCSAENRFKGVIERTNRGQINSEIVVRLNDGTELCAIVTSASEQLLNVKPGDSVWAVFNAYTVILHIA